MKVRQAIRQIERRVHQIYQAQRHTSRAQQEHAFRLTQWNRTSYRQRLLNSLLQRSRDIVALAQNVRSALQSALLALQTER